jgi:hypothetical protein
MRDAALAAGIGQFAGMAGVGPFQAFGQTSLPGMTGNFLGAGMQGPTVTGATVTPTLGQQFQQTTGMQGIRSLVGTPNQYNDAGQIVEKGSGFRSLSPGAQLGIGLGASTLLAGDEEDPEMPEGTRPEDYEKARAEANKQLEGILSKYDYESDAAGISPYNYGAGSMYTFKEGGIAEVKKFNKGGINYLPSKFDHDEHDYNNYVRAEGYIEDGSGNGDKDEDTMLAQLADGEFVSRADAILGAGIMEGADPKSYKDMRKKGAAFFYGQQAKFKRIFDLLDAARKKAN